VVTKAGFMQKRGVAHRRPCAPLVSNRRPSARNRSPGQIATLAPGKQRMVTPATLHLGWNPYILDAKLATKGCGGGWRIVAPETNSRECWGRIMLSNIILLGKAVQGPMGRGLWKHRAGCFVHRPDGCRLRHHQSSSIRPGEVQVRLKASYESSPGRSIKARRGPLVAD
jgi:hypothetical protein